MPSFCFVCTSFIFQSNPTIFYSAKWLSNKYLYTLLVSELSAPCSRISQYKLICINHQVLISVHIQYELFQNILMMQLMMLIEPNNRMWSKLSMGCTAHTGWIVGWRWCGIGASRCDVVRSIRILEFLCGAGDSNCPRNAIPLKAICGPAKIIYKAPALDDFVFRGIHARTMDNCAAFLQGNIPQLPFDELHILFLNDKACGLDTLKTNGLFKPCGTSKRAV